MSIHKLTAGHGYTYLTRQVAAQDRVERGGVSLASYYTEKGEAPGTWLGSGLAGLDGLAAGDVVTGEAMMNLFGYGIHPLAEQVRSAAIDNGVAAAHAQRAARLGTPYRVHADDIPAFRQRVAERMAAINEAAGVDRDAPGDPEVRARVRTEVAVELFAEDHGRAPANEREVIGSIAKHSRPRTRAVAGYDLTFSPVKSVSSLWAIADRPVAAAIERAHDLAVQDALTYLERCAVFTREGARGVRQVETRGLVAAAFTHRDSRAGDPDLHTHVAVANKVQAVESGKWLAIDGRVLYKANVAASETYNTRLEYHLRNMLGVGFAARTDTGPGKRPIREIAGIDPRLNQRWSTRRVSIETRRDELARQFHTTHGRPPTAIESIHLAQQATLETREAKHEPRSLAEQRTAWAAQARQVLGSDRAIAAMIGTVLTRGARTGQIVDAAWMRTTAARIVQRIQRDRSHWQRWHVEAEALRQVRGTDLPAAADIDRVVDLLVEHVLGSLSVPISGDADDQLPVATPDVLRRGDGASVYALAGSAMFTSPDILAAEQRIVAAAGIRDRRRMPAEAVDLAMLASTANGLPLNPGQAVLVREMATSGARVQLAIAPAGAGKTTAMRALTDAWTEGGGTVIGLAPSAAAADVLGSSIQTHADTLAKLLWHLDHPDHGETPAWANSIDTGTLVVIDEAGMADTLTLDRIITHVTNQGGSVRLIGDDRQLAAVGAGGILRDIHATHGALHLSELMRFTNPAEGAASLALREGQPEAIGFYLDHGRVHIGDVATLTDDVFTAWAGDHASGRDAIMLAPTRDLVANLNARARAHRLTTRTGQREGGRSPANVPPDNIPPPASVALADGNHGSVGDTIITRANDRRLHTSGTDWVKNGDRWTITTLHDSGALTVQHTRTRRQVTLPAAYVTGSVELGYATTIHTAQGVTADVSHTLLTGSEARTLVYTAATRGRDSNHLYVQVGGDGDPHGVIRPELTHPPTPTNLLEQILARDDSARSATTIARDANDPAVLLGQAVGRYLDSLVVAAQQHLGPDLLTRLDTQAERIVPGITTAASWESLRTHLVLAACNERNPLVLLRDAANQRPLDDVDDPAAVITWRLDTSNHHTGTGAGTAENSAADAGVGVGPLPWLPPIPTLLDQDPEWGPYLASRAASVRHPAHDITQTIEDGAAALPGWARQGHAPPPVDLLTDIEIFRAATAVDPADRRPTGPPVRDHAARAWQRHLDQRLQSGRTPAMQEWRDTLQQLITNHGRDAFVPVLAEQLAAMSRAGLDAPALLGEAIGEGPLPDDHQAAALWWRISSHLSPTVATQLDTGHHLTTAWTERLPQLIGATETRALQDSPWWPALVTSVEHAIARGNTLETLFANLPDPASDIDPCQGLTWRISTLTDTPPRDADDIGANHHDNDRHDEVEENPFWDQTPDRRFWDPTDDELAALPDDLPEPELEDEAPGPHAADRGDDELDVEATLAWAALMRQYAAPLEPSDQEIETALRRAYEADIAPVSPERIAELNQHALTYYMGCFPGSWAQAHLTERLHQDLSDDPQILPGYAPPGWTNLVNHLRRHGVSDLELAESGLASTTRDGRLIDRFRDRLILPITRTGHDGVIETIGFVARANPNLDTAQAGPKYLNTPDNPLFHKGAQLYVAGHDLLASNATPVLVEGPMDAIAATVATRGEQVGVASLGTALTEEQARYLAVVVHGSGREPVLAFDADDAGRRATHRGYWLLAQHGLHPDTVHLRPGSDPADVLTLDGPGALRETLQRQMPAAADLIEEHLTTDSTTAARYSIAILATTDPGIWHQQIQEIADRTGLEDTVARQLLAEQARRWHDNPRAAARDTRLPATATKRSTVTTPSQPQVRRPSPEPASRADLPTVRR